MSRLLLCGRAARLLPSPPPRCPPAITSSASSSRRASCTPVTAAAAAPPPPPPAGPSAAAREPAATPMQPASNRMAADSAPPPWQALGVTRQELCLDFTLPTGQSFRWRQTAPGEYTGVIGTRVVQMKQTPSDVLFRVLARGPQPEAPAARPPGSALSPTDPQPTPQLAPQDPQAADAAAVRGYFQLTDSGGLAAAGSSSGSSSKQAGTLSALVEGWAAADERFAAISPYFPGARMLRQDPVECMFQFICSSNNHISRIQGMVERLCQAYGTPLLLQPAAQGLLQPELQGQRPHPRDPGAAASPGGAAALQEGGLHTPLPNGKVAPGGGGDVPTKPRRKAGAAAGVASPAAGPGAPSSASASPAPLLLFHAFPTLEQLASASEEDLRAAGFGYRAKFITGSVAALRSKEGGGHAWLMALRQVPYRQAAEELCALPGIGPKVSACICLFSLDKHEAIPVDTHVWQIATRYYLPHLRGKALTKKVHEDVQQAFEQRFGAFAGWAHNTLFISELASQREQLPEALRVKQGKQAQGGGKRRKAQESSDEEEQAQAKDRSEEVPKLGKFGSAI